MARRRPGDKPLSEAMMERLLMQLDFLLDKNKDQALSEKLQHDFGN